MLELEHIQKSFDGVPVLKDISLQVADGEIVSILGPSGCGKTTLLNLILGIVDADSGRICYDGQDLTRTPMEKRGFNIVFQDYALFPNLNVLQNITYGLRNKPGISTKEEVEELIDLLGLREHLSKRIDQLSGGQKQRVAIAGVIAMQPRCIVLDEPTAMLDPIGRSEVLRTIRDLNRKKGVTVVLITHHMDEAAQADRLVVMTKGRVIADGPPRQVFQDVEGLRSVGLTVPDTTQLLWELRQEGLDVPLDALSDEECAQALCQLLNAASKKGSQP